MVSLRQEARRWRAVDGRRLATIAVIAILVYLVVGPLAMLIFSSFKGTIGFLPFEAGSPWTLDNYNGVFLNARTYRVLADTLIFTAGSLAVSLPMSVILAWLVERTVLPFRNLIYVLIVASTALPGAIYAISWSALLNPTNGWINVVIRDLLGMSGRGPFNIYTLPGLCFVQGLALVPITFLFISASFRSMDTTYEDAAGASGARRRTVLRRVTVPLMAPAILGALVYTFVSVIDSFDIPLILGLRGDIVLMSTEVFLQIDPAGGLPNYGVASAYGILLLLLAIGPVLIYNRVIGRSPDRFATVSGKSHRSTLAELGPWNLVALAFAFTFLFLKFLLPVFVMIWMSVQPFLSIPSIESLGRVSFDAYVNIWRDARVGRAFTNTFVLGVSAGLAAMVIGLLVSWILVRSRSRAKVLLDALAFAPHAFPGPIIGLSIALIYLMLPLPVYGTIWIIVIALSTQYISLGTRLMTGGIAQIHRELEEAAAVSGAVWRQTLVRVLVPLVLPAFLNGFILVFLASVKNLTLSLMLYSPDSVVLASLIWARWDQGDTAETAVLGVMMSVLTIGLAVFLRKVGSTRGVATEIPHEATAQAPVVAPASTPSR
jgi:iron(III) transport system permease protein